MNNNIIFNLNTAKYNTSTNNLPVLRAIIDNVDNDAIGSLTNIAFVCVQHLLDTTFDLFNSLVELGAKPHNIHIMGKSYSLCEEVVRKIIANNYSYYSLSKATELGSFIKYFEDDIKYMWKTIESSLKKNDIKSIIILDDGGYCIYNMPTNLVKKYFIVAVEQTSSGLTKISNSNLQIPVIEVASSAAKQILESPMIADAVARKIEQLVPIKKKTLNCAVVGLGAIGRAVTNKLLSLKHNVVTYDQDFDKYTINPQITQATTLNKLISASDYIFGCSGHDITEYLDISIINANKCFISCSSHDKEFLSLIKNIQENYSYQEVNGNIICKLKNNVTIEILQKGFPINFDGSNESVYAQDIQLTRGLLLGGILQAIYLLDKYSLGINRYMLDPNIQQFVTTNWALHGSAQFVNNQFLSCFKDINWIKQNSGGCFLQTT